MSRPNLFFWNTVPDPTLFIIRIRNRPKHPDPDPTKTPGSRSDQNNRIQFQPKQPDPDPTKIPGSGSDQNNRTKTTGSDQNIRILIRPKHPDPDPSKSPGSDQNYRILIRSKHLDPAATLFVAVLDDFQHHCNDRGSNRLHLRIQHRGVSLQGKSKTKDLIEKAKQGHTVCMLVNKLRFIRILNFKTYAINGAFISQEFKSQQNLINMWKINVL